jgi:CheY-like chemotaxis protein
MPPVVAVMPRRVLVVDDNRDSADTMGQLLRLLGSEVQTAHDGTTALELVEGYRPEVVLLDIGMPGMDGYQVARRIRERSEFNGVTLVALTGWGQADDRRRTRAAGFDEHLVKPADLAVLQSVLGAARPSATPGDRA